MTSREILFVDRDFEVGDQIVYFPTHVDKDDLHHPDVEFGFITGFNPEGNPFCRYWANPHRTKLRTTANSESTPREMVQHYVLKSQQVINTLLIELGYRKRIT